MYRIHANLCFVCEIQTEYKPRRIRGLYSVCISRTKQRVACVILTPILCSNQPPLNTPMHDKTTDMHSTAKVHWCLHPYICTALALCHCTCSISSASRYLSGYEGNFGNNFVSLISYNILPNHPGFPWIIQGSHGWSRAPGNSRNIQGKEVC